MKDPKNASASPDDDKKKAEEKQNKGLKPDPETLHTTDPQEHMKGPISSTMQNIKENAEEGDAESKAEAEKKRDENL